MEPRWRTQLNARWQALHDKIDARLSDLYSPGFYPLKLLAGDPALPAGVSFLYMKRAPGGIHRNDLLLTADFHPATPTDEILEHVHHLVRIGDTALSCSHWKQKAPLAGVKVVLFQDFGNLHIQHREVWDALVATYGDRNVLKHRYGYYPWECSLVLIMREPTYRVQRDAILHATPLLEDLANIVVLYLSK